MKTSPINNSQITTQTPALTLADVKRTKKDKLVATGSFLGAATGVATTLILISKGKKAPNGESLYLLKNNKPLSLKNIKNWKLLQLGEYKWYEIVAMASASLAGGLGMGLLLDDKKNRKAKLSEAIIQMVGNIIFPILAVSSANKLAKKICSKIKLPQIKNTTGKIANSINTSIKKVPEIIMSLTGLGIGIIVGNRVANFIDDKVFKTKHDRKIKLSDFSAHLDDIALATYLVVPDNKLGKLACKFIPPALCMPGFEAGRKREIDDRIAEQKELMKEINKSRY